MNLVKISSEVIEGKELNRDEINSNKIYLIVKRCMDFIGALCGIVLLSPVFLIVALLIKYEDPKGSVFLNKRELEKMEQDSTCINSVLW